MNSRQRRKKRRKNERFWAWAYSLVAGLAIEITLWDEVRLRERLDMPTIEVFTIDAGLTTSDDAAREIEGALANG